MSDILLTSSISPPLALFHSLSLLLPSSPIPFFSSLSSHPPSLPLSQIYLSWKSGPAEVKHWKDMMGKPRNAVQQWHALKA